MNKNLKAAAATVMLAVAGFLLYRHFSAPTAVADDVTFFQCLAPDCKNEFGLKTSELVKIKAANAQRLPCPKCNDTRTRPAFQCPSCRKLYEPIGHGATPKNCPLCNAPIPQEP